jgi:hypothetical protein
MPFQPVRTLRRLGLAIVLALAGCEVTSHGDALPGVRAYADRDYYDRWNGIEPQYRGSDATRLSR